MSLKISKLVRSRIIGSGSLKAVLLCMADRVEHDDGRFYKSRATIEGETDLGRSTVKRALEQLTEMGLIECIGTRRCKNGKVMVYRLILSRIAALPEWKADDEDEADLSTTGFTVDPVQSGPGSERTPTGARADPDGVQTGPQYVLETSIKLSAGEREAVDNPQPVPKPILTIEERQRISADVFGRQALTSPAPIPDIPISQTLTDHPITDGEFLQ